MGLIVSKEHIDILDADRDHPFQKCLVTDSKRSEIMCVAEPETGGKCPVLNELKYLV